MHDLTQLADRVFSLNAEMALRISELEQLRNRVATAERKSYGASRKAKKAVYEAAGLAGQQRDLPTSAWEIWPEDFASFPPRWGRTWTSVIT
jgi:hypothetical protein